MRLTNKNNYIGVVIDKLYNIFDILNKEYFSDKLDPPVITIQRAKRSGNLGWFSIDKIWTNKSENSTMHEINISAEHLRDDIYSIAGTMLHEMVHYANKLANIKDCSGQKHNKKFKSLAEQVGLLVEKSEKYGWGYTSCSDELVSFIDTYIKPTINESDFKYFRNVKSIEKEEKKRQKKIFKYTCPKCSEEIKAKRDKDILCGKCNCKFVMEEE